MRWWESTILTLLLFYGFASGIFVRISSKSLSLFSTFWSPKELFWMGWLISFGFSLPTEVILSAYAMEGETVCTFNFTFRIIWGECIDLISGSWLSKCWTGNFLRYGLKILCKVLAKSTPSSVFIFGISMDYPKNWFGLACWGA